jgi:ABC-2 type transport system ATP-binding protein
MYNDLTGLENLIFYGQIFGRDKSESEKCAMTLLEKLELVDAKDKKLSTYSTGMRQRLSLARALIHEPKMLFLDEPTSGLDPESAQMVNNFIKDLAREYRTTIFLCTHQLRYAEEICTSYGLIDKGIMFAKGTLNELRAQVNSCHKLIIKSDTHPVGVKFKIKAEHTFELEVESEVEAAKIVADIVKSGGRVFHVSTAQLSLEEIYFTLTRRQGG